MGVRRLSPSANACVHARADFSPRQANKGNRSEWPRNVTVLVTGSAGYIRSHRVHALLEAGEQKSKSCCSAA